MTIETLLTKVIENAPNLIIAVYVLWRQQSVIEQLLQHQRTLIDKLLEMVDREPTDKVIISGSNRSAQPPAPPNIAPALLAILSAFMIGLLR